MAQSVGYSIRFFVVFYKLLLFIFIKILLMYKYLMMISFALDWFSDWFCENSTTQTMILSNYSNYKFFVQGSFSIRFHPIFCLTEKQTPLRMHFRYKRQLRRDKSRHYTVQKHSGAFPLEIIDGAWWRPNWNRDRNNTWPVYKGDFAKNTTAVKMGSSRWPQG